MAVRRDSNLNKALFERFFRANEFFSVLPQAAGTCVEQALAAKGAPLGSEREEGPKDADLSMGSELFLHSNNFPIFPCGYGADAACAEHSFTIVFCTKTDLHAFRPENDERLPRMYRDSLAWAYPHDSGALIAPPDFSSGKPKSAGNTLCISEHFGKAWRKRCKQAVCRELCGYAHALRADGKERKWLSRRKACTPSTSAI